MGNIKDLISTVMFISMVILYFFGMYIIITDDHRYTTKDVVIAGVFFPYPWYAGGKEVYKLLTVSAGDRMNEAKCLDATEAIGMPRKSRLRYCECAVKTKNPKACRSKIFLK